MVSIGILRVVQEDFSTNPSAQWEYERLIANPSIPQVVMMVAPATAIYIALSWGIDTLLQVGLAWWIHPIVALFVAVTLIQGIPSELRNHLDQNASFIWRLRFNVPLWSARSVLLVVLFNTYYTFVDLDPPSRWLYFGVMAIVIVPVIWFALLQTRQFGHLSVLGRVPAAYLPAGILIPVSQVAMWGATASVWFGDYSIWPAIAATILSAVWHAVGNAILFALLLRAQRGRRTGQ